MHLCVWNACEHPLAADVGVGVCIVPVCICKKARAHMYVLSVMEANQKLFANRLCP